MTGSWISAAKRRIRPSTRKSRTSLSTETNRMRPSTEASRSSLSIVESRTTLLAVKSRTAALSAENVFVHRQERDITSGTRKLDIQPDAHELPLHAPSLEPFVRYTSVPVVHKRARLNIGIALLMLGIIGALAWSGPLLMGMRRDAGTWGALIQNASPPTPTVPLESPTNVLPPAAAPQPPATDVPAESATPSEPAIAIATPSKAPGANAPNAPRAERPVRQEERLPVNADPNAAGGLFAITRPLGAQVFLDNKLIGTTPLFMSQLSSGSHEVRLELPGFRTYSSSIQVEPSRRFRLAVQLDETR